MNGKNRVSPKLVVVSNIPNDNSLSHSLSLLDRAFFYLEKERGDSAFSLLKKISPASLPSFSRSEYYERLGQAYSLTGRFVEARSSYLKALSLAKARKDKSNHIFILKKIGDTERQLENFSSAKIRFSQVAQSAHGPLRIDALCGLALSLRGMAQYKEARREFINIVSLYRKDRDKIGEAYALWALGTTERFMGLLKDGEMHAAQALRQYKTLGDEGGQAFALSAWGGILRMRGLAQKSGECYLRANKIFKKLGDRFGLAYSFCGMGNSFRMREQFETALKYSSRAEKIYRELGLKGPLAFVLWSKAQAEIALGQLTTAKAHLGAAEKLFHAVKDARGLVYAQLGWAEFYRSVKPSRAISIYRRAERSSRQKGLWLENAHAQFRLLGNKNGLSAYKKCGVSLNEFLTYSTLP